MADKSFRDIMNNSGSSQEPIAPQTFTPKTGETVNKPGMDVLSDAWAAVKDYPRKSSQQTLDMLRTGINSGTFGGLDEAYGLYHSVTANKPYDEPFKEGFDEGRAQAQGSNAAALERLPLLPELVAEIGGTMSKKSPVGALASVIEKGVGRGSKASGIGAKLLRGARDLATQFGVGAAEGMIRGTVNNIETGRSIAENATDLGWGDALEGGAGGAAGHLVLGMALPKMAKYGIGMGLLSNSTRAQQKVGELLLDTGAQTPGGVTPANIRAGYTGMRADDTNIFQTGVGDESAAEMTNRMADIVAQTEFGQADFADNFDVNTERYMQTMSHINDFVGETVDSIKTNFADAIGAPRASSKARQAELAPELKKYEDTYKSLVSTKEGTMGANPVPYRGIMDSLEAKIADGLNYAEVSDMSSLEGDVYSTMVNELRPSGLYAHTRGLHRVPHDNVDGVNLDTANTKLNSLIRARQALSTTYKVGQLQNGTAVKPEQARAAAVMIKNLDLEIAARSGGTSDDARNNFAKWMRVKDAEQVGATFYSNNLVEHPDLGVSMKEYMDANADDPDVIQAFKDGYSRSMATAINEGAPLGVVQNLVGDVSRGDLEGLDVNSTGINNLRMILGKDKADKLVTEFLDNAELRMAQERLRGYLKSKKFAPEDVDGVVREMDDLLIATGLNPAMGATMFATSTLGAVSRKAKSLGLDEAELVMELTKNTGRRGTDTVEGLLRTLETPERVSMGTSGVVTADDPEVEKKDAASMASMTDYLNSLSGQ